MWCKRAAGGHRHVQAAQHDTSPARARALLCAKRVWETLSSPYPRRGQRGWELIDGLPSVLL